MMAIGDYLLRSAVFTDLDAPTLYAILQLRLDVFVVEQRCIYRELDGRDTEPTARHMWLAGPSGAIAAYLRTLTEDSGVTRVGRVVTAPAFRGRSLADQLLGAALAGIPGPVVADVQEYLQTWYGRHGFVASAPPLLYDGIPHVPMRRSARGTGRR